MRITMLHRRFDPIAARAPRPKKERKKANKPAGQAHLGNAGRWAAASERTAGGDRCIVVRTLAGSKRDIWSWGRLREPRRLSTPAVEPQSEPPCMPYLAATAPKTAVQLPHRGPSVIHPHASCRRHHLRQEEMARDCGPPPRIGSLDAPICCKHTDRAHLGPAAWLALGTRHSSASRRRRSLWASQEQQILLLAY